MEKVYVETSDQLSLIVEYPQTKALNLQITILYYWYGHK